MTPIQKLAAECSAEEAKTGHWPSAMNCRDGGGARQPPPDREHAPRRQPWVDSWTPPLLSRRLTKRSDRALDKDCNGPWD